LLGIVAWSVHSEQSTNEPRTSVVQRQVELAQDERAELTAVHTKTHGAGAEACWRRTREKRAPPMGVEDEGRAEAVAAAEQEERRAEKDQLVALLGEGGACLGGVDGQAGDGPSRAGLRAAAAASQATAVVGRRVSILVRARVCEGWRERGRLAG
jgi:hypothetical protein